jgi:hypothetical protein
VLLRLFAIVLCRCGSVRDHRSAHTRTDGDFDQIATSLPIRTESCAGPLGPFFLLEITP